MAPTQQQSSEYLDFDVLYKYIIKFSYFNGTYPYIRRDWKWFLHALAMHGYAFIYFILILASIFLHDVPNKKMTEACYNGTIGSFGVVVTLHYALFVLNQSSLVYLMDTMKSDYKAAELYPIRERDIIIQYAKKGKFIANYWSFACVLTGEAFLIKSSISMLYHSISEHKLVALHLIDTVTYPNSIEEIKDDTLPFIVTYITANWYCFYGTTLFISISIVGPIFLIHACGQLELLKLKINELFPKNENEFDPRIVRTKLNGIAAHIDRVYQFVGEIEQSLKLIYEIIMKGTSLTMPLTIFQLLESYKAGATSIELLPIIFGYIYITGCPCLYGELLLQQGESVREALYMCGWEKFWDKSARKSIVIILTKMLEPIAIRIVFIDICHATLTEVYKSVYTIFNLMCAVYG